MSKEQVSNAYLLGRILKNLNSLKNTKDDGEKENIAEEIRKAISELEGIRSYFDSVEDPELLDYAIFREKAALTRLSYLLRKAKYIAKNDAKSINI
jgi:hypothetical protein